MARLLAFFFALTCWLYPAGNPKDLYITQVVPYGKSNIKITFNKKITLADIKQKTFSPTKEVLDIQAILSTKRRTYHFPDKSKAQIAQYKPKITRIVLTSPKKLSYGVRIVEKNLYIEIDPKDKEEGDKILKDLPLSKKSPSKAPQTPSSKKRIVIDAGHGGKDCGAIGVVKVCEKVITLDVAKLLENELKKRGYIVYMTRSKDTYLGLRERTQYANAKNADLFISIHANSVPKRSSKNANGIETYFLSTARSERAKNVAEKENKDDIDAMNYFSKLSYLNSMNTHRLIASNKLAIDIQSGILRELKAKYPNLIDGGVREGPFWVLAGALMPSVLIEIGYISHPTEGRRINHRDYQITLAKGIADGIEGYFAKNP
ncbi:N-acetylmuramoyl-L-alanine amidase family protein [Helicobacter brantae]|uniref:N-acetylmuramoyl-L-alanine amidase n=1 Tax=Helicobacter brantae TaxID=375927 RepID=A0A3D8J243_9HELI|nr:N-acetylmuramoyl-L-alanine amidase [Helicobacter brantae]RDU71453.1 N-acetylmuramoyl-L-alanine amidase [Helicobacter brantae]